jgi:hypothetical protein
MRYAIAMVIGITVCVSTFMLSHWMHDQMHRNSQ